MRYLQRGAAILLLLALIVSVPSLFAQEEGGAQVAGSGIIAPLFEALVGASGVETNVTIDVTGTNGGFEAFCTNTADVTLASRPISGEEDAKCAANNIEYVELLVGHNIIAFVSNSQSTFQQCLTVSEINTVFSPSAVGNVTNWTFVNPESSDVPLKVTLPAVEGLVYVMLDARVSGDGLRGDATVANTDADILTVLAGDTGAIGVMTYEAAIAAGDQVRILQVNEGGTSGCTSPSAETVEDSLYTFADRLFVYVNQASLEKTGLRDVLSFATSAEGAETVIGSGFTAPSAMGYDSNAKLLAGEIEGRQFSQDAVEFVIPPTLSGQINIGGAGNLSNFMQTAVGQFTSIYPNLAIDLRIEGEAAGIRRLCNGEIDIAVTSGDLTAEQANNCAANNIDLYTIDLGSQAVVLVGHGANDYLSCLTTAQVNTIWNAASGGTVKTWSQVDATFPETPLTLFGLSENSGSVTSDLLFSISEGSVPPVREDTEHDFDSAYRAAATANVDGGLTYMSWSEYERVVSNGQVNIQLVSIDGGDGCVAPSATTIGDGTYPLSRPARLVVNEIKLADVNVQSFLWDLLSDSGFSQLGLLGGSSGLVSIDAGELPKVRSDLLVVFQLAQQSLAQSGVEVTPETTLEPSAEATPESTQAVGS